MNTNDLISQLTSQLKPVKPQKSLTHRTLVLFLISLLFVVAGVGFWYLKKQEFHIPSDRSLIELITLAVAFLFSLIFATKSASPHSATAKKKKLPMIFVFLWFALLMGVFVRLYLTNSVEALVAFNYKTWLCPLVILTIAIPLFISSILYIFRGSVLFLKPTLSYLTILSLSGGAIGLSFICPWADPLHEILWHVLPVILMSYLVSIRMHFRKIK